MLDPTVKRLLIAAAEALVVGLVSYYVMQPAKLALLRSQLIHRAMLAARAAAVACGNGALALEAAYNRSTN